MKPKSNPGTHSAHFLLSVIASLPTPFGAFPLQISQAKKMKRGLYV
jgi:hypothetical protein